MPVALGLGLPQMKQYDISRDVAVVARAAEAVGYESLWVFERVLFPEPATQGLYGVPGLAWPDQYRSVADPLVTLALAAAATERARLGTSVLVAPLHVPFQLARSLASLDAASGGRVIAGLGTGWSLDEYAAASVAPFEKRGEVLDELLDVCAAVWGPDPVSYKGNLTTIAPSEVGPKPARPIPVYLPAGSARATRRLVDRADGWMPVAMGVTQLSEQWQRVQDVAAERGRRRPVGVCARANARYSATPVPDEGRKPFHGNTAQIVEDLVAHAATGVPEIMLDLQGTLRDASQLVDVATEVYESARAAGV
ncbi:TIGR03619 family F420-dependent LLM class oxidoreductase [Streptomyces sp. NPDC050529]|uniref:TIGR03619 family F420-dependent LLM class oxidoreductase n=1 Tax=unclassified Streptomyces TaxID=2593676 RepID=UPI002DDB9C32|nr:TIGR03619 family F420-dependent LLM class oxidoreductase [Streptomyces sp. NBC_01022]WRZ78914.1 TIGR03619 family F420-dependent LLM class oxidoreductase [Streptomyces sp. NBC_01022]WRZ86765.1 TIGR03619 family F420-dependent LLM class oxidoreductase [Streptomyces sp. NBC_01022]